MTRKAIIVGINEAWTTEVSQLRCNHQGCPHIVSYMGDEDNIFNYSNKHLITYEACLDYWHTMTCQKCTFRSYHKSLGYRYSHQGCLKLLPSCNTVR